MIGCFYQRLGALPGDDAGRAAARGGAGQIEPKPGDDAGRAAARGGAGQIEPKPGDDAGRAAVAPTFEGIFTPTDFTRSNWSRDIQHGSPALALLTKAIEELSAGSGLRIGRLSMDILGAIPVTSLLRVRAWVERPGSRISLFAAEMLADRDNGPARAVARVTAWLLAVTDTADVASDRYPPLVEGPTTAFPVGFDGLGGYFDGIRWRPQRAETGSAAVAWFSPLVHVVDTEPTSALQRLAAVVDCANGVGAILDTSRFAFMNTDTVVHLHRLPVGNDFALRARASVGPDGVGVTTAEVFDQAGFVGTSAQTLLVERK